MNFKLRMRTLYFVLLACCGTLAGASASAQGTVFLNNYDSGMGIHLSSGTAAPAHITFAEVYGGATPASLLPLGGSLGEDPIFTIGIAGVEARGPGSGSYFDGGYGSVPGVPPLGTAWFWVVAWTGAPTWQSADLGGFSGPWSQQIGTIDHPAALNLPQPIVMTLDWIPEPSVLALSVLASVGLLGERARRRLAGSWREPRQVWHHGTLHSSRAMPPAAAPCNEPHPLRREVSAI